MTLGQLVTINSRKFDRSVRRSWTCRLVEQDNPLLLFVGEFDEDISHPDLGLVKSGTISYEYYWLDRWYNIFRFHEPGGSLRNYYCNINMPPVFENGVLDYVDLDIDVLVWPDSSFHVLDLDEYEQNAARFNYPASVRSKVTAAIDELLAMIENDALPKPD